MKFALFYVLTLVHMQVAFAFPNVGDEAHYEGCRPTEDGCIHFTKEHQIVSHNASAGTFDINVRLWEQGSGPQYRTVTVNADDLPSTKDVQQLFARCAGNDGKVAYDKIEITVPAGTFPVCKVYHSETGDTRYIANVPFGILKAEGPTVNMELMSFKSGAPTPKK